MEKPNFSAVEGVFFDFKYSFRILSMLKDVRVKLYDDYNDLLLTDFILQKNKLFDYGKHFYVDYRFQVYDNEKLIFQYKLDLNNKDVVVKITGQQIGDTIAFMRAIQKFQQKYNCKIFLDVTNYTSVKPFQLDREKIIVLNPEKKLQFQKQYFKKKYQQLDGLPVAQYILYSPISINKNSNKVDGTCVGLNQIAFLQLNVDYDEIRPKYINVDKIEIEKKYAVICSQDLTPQKMWDLKKWQKIVQFLHSKGYYVFQVGLSGEKINGCDEYSIDNLQLIQRIKLLKGAQFYVGSPNAISWLSWLVQIPVVLINGFTPYFHQVKTKYYVTNFHTCHYCYLNCKSKQLKCQLSGERYLQCQKSINVKMVENTIQKLINDIV